MFLKCLFVIVAAETSGTRNRAHKKNPQCFVIRDNIKKKTSAIIPM